MPEVNLESLIRQLQEEGVEKANHQAAEIIAEAKSQAAEIVSTAQSSAQQITDKAVQESEKLKQSALADIKQGARDVVLLVKGELSAIACRAFGQNVSVALTPQLMGELILKIAPQLSQGQNIIVTVSENDKQALIDLLPSAFKAIGREVEIKVDDNMAKGFRIGLQGESVVYDFSDEAIFASIKELVSAAVKDILNHG
jgi:V/A-type H+-transporting ATPase subunit E